MKRNHKPSNENMTGNEMQTKTMEVNKHWKKILLPCTYLYLTLAAVYRILITHKMDFVLCKSWFLKILMLLHEWVFICLLCSGRAFSRSVNSVTLAWRKVGLYQGIILSYLIRMWNWCMVTGVCYFLTEIVCWLIPMTHHIKQRLDCCLEGKKNISPMMPPLKSKSKSLCILFWWVYCLTVFSVFRVAISEANKLSNCSYLPLCLFMFGTKEVAIHR